MGFRWEKIQPLRRIDFQVQRVVGMPRPLLKLDSILQHIEVVLAFQ
jgi:hypothetical protein